VMDTKLRLKTKENNQGAKGICVWLDKLNNEKIRRDFNKEVNSWTITRNKEYKKPKLKKSRNN
jgi:hypothetical protein